MTTNHHRITRIQHEPLKRTVKVVSVEDLTPSMRRFVFHAESLKTFESLGFDDHVKVFFPARAPANEPMTAARDFTPRKIDVKNGLLTIDFALHDSGVATTWARQAQKGDTLDIGGPRGSQVVTDDFDWYLMIGDETAMPAIGRRLEELRAGVPVTTIITIANSRERQRLQTAAALTPIWIERNTASGSSENSIRSALDEIKLPSADGHIWLAGESQMIRSLRSYLVADRGHPAEWLRAAGYWKRGTPGAHEKI